MDLEDVEADAMAAAMGFSSFGTQEPALGHGPAKRRKFNRHADAVVEDNSSHNQPHHDGSGANNIPLGERRPRNDEAVMRNEDEIQLDDEDEDEGMDNDAQHDADADGPTYVDTSRLAPIEEKQLETARQRLLSGLDGPQLETHVLPARPPPSVSSQGSSLAMSHRPPIRGQRNPLWYVDYYDPSFNENPWAKLEASRGLQEKGTWLRREQKA